MPGYADDEERKNSRVQIDVCIYGTTINIRKITSPEFHPKEA